MPAQTVSWMMGVVPEKQLVKVVRCPYYTDRLLLLMCAAGGVPRELHQEALS